MTKRRVWLMIGFMWTLSLIVSLAPLIGWKSPQPNGKICEVNEDVAYALFSASFSFHIPLMIILIVYYRIYKEARAQSKFLKTGIKTSKTTDGSGASITLRVHIGPTNSKRPQQTPNACSCKLIQNGSYSPICNQVEKNIRKSNSCSEKALASMDELTPFDPNPIKKWNRT